MSALSPFLRAVERRLVLERDALMAVAARADRPEPKPPKARKPMPRVTTARRDAIVSLYTSGTRNAAYWTLKRAGVLRQRANGRGPRLGARLTREERKARDAEIMRRTADGESARELAQAYQLTMRGVEHAKRRMRAAGWK